MAEISNAVRKTVDRRRGVIDSQRRKLVFERAEHEQAITDIDAKIAAIDDEVLAMADVPVPDPVEEPVVPVEPKPRPE